MTGFGVTRPLPGSWILFGAGAVLVAGSGIGAFPELLGRLAGPPVLVLLYRIRPTRAVWAIGAGLLILLALTRDPAPLLRIALPLGLSALLLARGILRGGKPVRVVFEATLPFLLASLPFFLHPETRAEREAEAERNVVRTIELYRELGTEEAVLKEWEGTVRRVGHAATAVEPAVGFLILAAFTTVLYRITTGLLARYGLETRRIAPFRYWRVPFGLVWVFAAGLAGVLIGGSPVGETGANLLCFSAAVFWIDGLAVLIWQFRSRRISVPIQVVFFTASALLVFPLFLIMTIGAGLIDAWVDFRHLESVDGGPQKRESEGRDS
ncbi:MAG: DUF2232 domain-containing protein [Candidatus Eisenbacteria bacterium]|nr:DUF2232 domain-containing protein [Candidatus Eisenbacteria bacterium]